MGFWRGDAQRAFPEDEALRVVAGLTEFFLLHVASGQRREFDKWLPLALHSKDFRPALSRVAFDGDEIVGYVLTYRDNDPTRSYIGHVGTRRPWRGKAVASALMAEVIEAARQAGYSHVCLGVDADSPTGAVGVYERAGFKRIGRFGAYPDNPLSVFFERKA